MPRRVFRKILLCFSLLDNIYNSNMGSNTDTTDPKDIGIAFAIFFAVVGVGILLGLGSVYLDVSPQR